MIALMQSSQLTLARARRPHNGLEDRLADVHLDLGRGRHLNPGFQRVLVAIDGSDHDASALTGALTTVDPHGGRVQLVHVRTGPEESAAEASELLDAAVRAARARGLDASGCVVTASRSCVAGAILRAASACDAQVVIVAHGPRHGLATHLRDSVEGELLRTSPCPVLSIPAR